MGLKDIDGVGGKKGVKWSKDKLNKEDICPSCGSSNTEKVSYYWRCNNNSCDTLTYISSGYEVDQSLLEMG